MMLLVTEPAVCSSRYLLLSFLAHKLFHSQVYLKMLNNLDLPGSLNDYVEEGALPTC